MKILDTSQIRAADQYTIENEPIASIDLMERASQVFVDKFLELFANQKPVSIFCGTGNNGGDGLAIGRLLIDKGWEVTVFILGDKGSEDFEKNLKRLSRFELMKSEKDFPSLQENQIIIDGLFGSGLSRPIEGLASKLIQFLNSQNVMRVAIDIASGVFADRPMEKFAVAIKAAYTISFQAPKLVFFLPQYHEFNGVWYAVDIGLNQKFIEDQKSFFHFSEASKLEKLAPVRNTFAHKAEVGKLLIVAGSQGKMGAAALCAKAALRAGVGLVNVQVPQCGIDILQVLVPEAMVIPDVNQKVISGIAQHDSTIAIGPGIGTEQETKKALSEFLDKVSDPIVLDADALNIISEDKSLLGKVPKESIMTPHPGEFKRLVGEWQDDFERLELLRSFCINHALNVVLKGAYSSVCNSDGYVYFNPTGNPGMATAGSGDVLTGVVGSFLAQGLKPFDALRLGVYLHGQAGDKAAKKMGGRGLIASDIINHLAKS